MGEICRSVIKDMGFGLGLGIGIGYPTERFIIISSWERSSDHVSMNDM